MDKYFNVLLLDDELAAYARLSREISEYTWLFQDLTHSVSLIS
jgi:hypothetical protein